MNGPFSCGPSLSVELRDVERPTAAPGSGEPPSARYVDTQLPKEPSNTRSPEGGGAAEAARTPKPSAGHQENVEEL
eukprot:5588744-Alexandrium_andersonii.AAC.1